MEIKIKGTRFVFDETKPIDISLPVTGNINTVNAFFLPPVTMEPFRIGSFTGSVSEGGSCNVSTITLNPHGNCTHTETVGHISPKPVPINRALKKFFFLARLITIKPELFRNDRIITRNQIQDALPGKKPEALIIRTLPNDSTKRSRNYSGTNPPYLDAEAAEWIRMQGIQHLLLDLPSVDKEDDGGFLSAHHAFWNYPAKPLLSNTITELIFVPNAVKDGTYILNLMIAPFENDAAPSKPILYSIIRQNQINKPGKKSKNKK